MSGCQEGILVDLSEPLENSLVTVTDSIEYLRDDPSDCIDDMPKFSSPLKNVDSLLLDISTKSDTPNQPSPIRLIDAETFDFDLSVTPGTSSDKSIPDEEEEVFFGPMGYRERCVSTVVTSITKERKPLSPLNPRQIAEICKEANAVACRISSVASGKKGKKLPKENLFCVKQLRLDQTVLSKEAEGSLLHSVRKIKTSDDTDKENCDNQPMDIDTNDENLKTLEAFLRNEVTETNPSSKSSSSESESCESPAKRHNRSGTYTLDKTPHDLLSADKRKSLPVVGNVNRNSISVKDEGQGETGRRSISKLQQPASKLVKSSIPGMKGPKPVSKPDSKETTTSNTGDKPQMKSRLSAPKAGSLLPSKLKPVGMTTASTTSCIPAKPVQQLPKKSALPGLKGRGAPISKLTLMKPSGLQKPGSMQAKNSDSTKKNGPMKAFAPLKKQEVEKAPTAITPSKQEKKVHPKNLSSSFSTPTRNGSTSSVDSPVSSVNKRRSFLPTPNKSRLGSNGSNASPCPSRTSSTSSQRSIESPLVKGPSSATRSATKFTNVDHIDDSSPSAMRPKRQLVTNTPNMPKKKLSQWSPVQKKKPHDLIDQAIMCTKKIRR